MSNWMTEWSGYLGKYDEFDGILVIKERET